MLDDYGWSASVAARLAAALADGAYPGRAVRVDKGSTLVVTETATVDATVAQALGGIAVGDWVAVRGDDTSGRMIAARAERTSAIVRRDPSPSDNRDQVIAANIDSALILYRLDRKLRLAVLERYMVLVWDSGITPVVVLSKGDLVASEVTAEAIGEVRRSVPDVDVIAVSAVSGAGMDRLDGYLIPGATVALLGESGAGKSTLINRMVGIEILATGETRSRDGRGRHTTTAREMLPIGRGAVVIDTPGLRSVGLTQRGDGMRRVFGDILALADYCRFRDCAHAGEPGCAVETAISHGVLDRRRLDSYLKLESELERVAQRKEDIARRAEQRRQRG